MANCLSNNPEKLLQDMDGGIIEHKLLWHFDHKH